MEQIVCSAVHLFAYGMLLGSSFHASIYVPEYESAMFMELPGEMQHPALTMYDRSISLTVFSRQTLHTLYLSTWHIVCKIYF